jgi:peptidoglycan/LPS O-acetylase OafA/YrhL
MIINQFLKSKKTLKSINGWRAVSILFVLIQHSMGKTGFPLILRNQMFDAIGGVGVRFFFVISGFLITWLLIKEFISNNFISIKAFYFRRIFRILPIFLLLVLICYFLNIFNYIIIPNLDFIKIIFFMGDIHNVNSPFAHLWSLGLEEKYYLIWPCVFLLFYPNSNKLVKILLLIIFIEPILRFLVNFYNLDNFRIFNYHSFLIIFDGLVIGSLGAIIFHKGIFFELLKKINFFLILVISIILIILPLLFWKIKVLNFLQPLQDTLQCSGFLMLMIMSIIKPDFFAFKILNSTLFNHLGKISYSIYIWMGLIEIINFDFKFTNIHINDFPFWLFVLIIISEISYYLIEKPIIRNRYKFSSFLKKFIK